MVWALLFVFIIILGISAIVGLQALLVLPLLMYAVALGWSER